MPLNPFGQAWRDSNFIWTRALCEMDSDGDGLTNGQELGDPCCLWRRHDEPSEYMKLFTPSHPGMANTDGEVAAMPNVTDCSSTAPAARGFMMNEFNPGEEQHEMDLLVDNYELSSDRTIYVDIGMNIPTDVLDAHEIYHAVFATAIVDKVANLHHFVVRACSDLWPEEVNGRQVDRRAQNRNNCDSQGGIWSGWAPGGDVVSTPAWAGLPFGRGVGIVSFSVNIHYDNPSQQSGIVDSSGIQMRYTPNLREHNIHALSTTTISVNPQIMVPPGLRRWFLTRECVLDLRDQETGEPAELHITGVTYHAHLLGREMYTEYWPAGEQESIDLGSEPVWHFDDQSLRNILSWNISLRTGDRLQTTCVMDSTGQSTDTRFGIETTDEMCWASFAGWPSTSNGLSYESTCMGRVWSGSLAVNEPGFGIATRHPEAEARNAWDGTSLMNGGLALRLQGRPPVCEDMGWFCTMQSAELRDDPNFTCTGPLSDVTALREMMDDSPLLSVSILELCCATACNTICRQASQCQGGDELPTIPEPEEPGPESWANLQIRSMTSCGVSDSSNSDSSNTCGQGVSSFSKCVAALPLFLLFQLAR